MILHIILIFIKIIKYNCNFNSNINIINDINNIKYKYNCNFNFNIDDINNINNIKYNSNIYKK